jgi:hypothetical protein
MEHADSHLTLATCLGLYVLHTPGVLAGDNATLRLSGDVHNQPQSDCHLRIDPAFGGRTRLTADGYIEGIPELVAEIAVSSSSFDLHDKLDLYREHGALEYLVWRVWDRAIDWLRFAETGTVPLTPGANGISRSLAFPGLWLDVPALIRNDRQQILNAVTQGVQSQEHRAFVEQLAKKRTST